MGVSKREGMEGNFKTDTCWEYFWLDDRKGPSVQEQIILEQENMHICVHPNETIDKPILKPAREKSLITKD